SEAPGRGPMIGRRRSVTSGLGIAALVALGVFAAVPAWATGPMMGGNRTVVRVDAGSPGGAAQRGLPGYPPNASPHNFGPSYPFGSHYAGPSYPFGRTYTRPSHPSNQFTQFVPPPATAPRWVPGHWAQQWMPQYYTYNVWVPGY